MQSKKIWLPSPASTPTDWCLPRILVMGRQRLEEPWRSLASQSSSISQWKDPVSKTKMESYWGRLLVSTFGLQMHVHEHPCLHAHPFTCMHMSTHTCTCTPPTYSHNPTPYKGKEFSRRDVSEIEFPRKLNLRGNLEESVDLILSEFSQVTWELLHKCSATFKVKVPKSNCGDGELTHQMGAFIGTSCCSTCILGK